MLPFGAVDDRYEWIGKLNRAARKNELIWFIKDNCLEVNITANEYCEYESGRIWFDPQIYIDTEDGLFHHELLGTVAYVDEAIVDILDGYMRLHYENNCEEEFCTWD